MTDLGAGVASLFGEFFVLVLMDLGGIARTLELVVAGGYGDPRLYVECIFFAPEGRAGL